MKKIQAALLLIDLQNDFCTGGALAVPEGETIIPIANQLQDVFEMVIATQDWHPHHHGSFASSHPPKKPGDIINLNGIQQVLWPDHCVANSEGANFHPKLNIDHFSHIVKKGMDPKLDSYSAFFDNAHLRSTDLADYLKHHNINTVYIMGLATDYCVLFSVLDALMLGFQVYLIEDGCRGINLEKNDIPNALSLMQEKGAYIIQSKELMKQSR